MLAGLATPDLMQTRFPIETFEQFKPRIAEVQVQIRTIRKNKGTDAGDAADKERKRLIFAARRAMSQWMGLTLLRRAYSATAFRERLVGFWGDHFTAAGKANVLRSATSPYLEEAIRPNINGRFADLLKAAVTHPLMLQYLDQVRSMGPNSVRARKLGKARGLNENLAREVLELHTLGVGGDYSQTDVRQLAELFTGLSIEPDGDFLFRKGFVEPGSETVLGRSYADDGTVAPVHAALEDLAAHPATARHLARKLAVHFVSDDPPSELINAVAQAYSRTDGNLHSVYTALLEHQLAWTEERTNMKPPEDFVASAFRALGVPENAIRDMQAKISRRALFEPMAAMGQRWQRPLGPDGWPEEDDAWITPQGLTWRIRWAMQAPEFLMPQLPDPRDFVETALGRFATDELRFAAGAAESVPEAIGIVLMSPAFQRR